MPPTPKHRQRKTSKRRHKEPKPPIKLVDGQKVRISKVKFNAVRNDPDFVTAIQVGRIINALGFGIELLQNLENDKTAVGRRFGARAFFINASYLHESLKVLYGLRGRYAGEEYFNEVRAILYPKDNRQEDILKLIRNTGFHLDEERKATESALSNLKLIRYDLFSFDGPTLNDFYFDFADAVDQNFLIDSFMTATSTENEVQEEIARAIYEMLQAIGHACNVFLTALLRKLGLIIEFDQNAG